MNCRSVARANSYCSSINRCEWLLPVFHPDPLSFTCALLPLLVLVSQPPIERSFLRQLWDQIKDFIIMVLLVAAIVSMAIEDWEAAAVLVRNTSKFTWRKLAQQLPRSAHSPRTRPSFFLSLLLFSCSSC